MTHTWYCEGHALPRGIEGGDLLPCLAVIHVGNGHTTAIGVTATVRDGGAEREGFFF